MSHDLPGIVWNSTKNGMKYCDSSHGLDTHILLLNSYSDSPAEHAYSILLTTPSIQTTTPSSETKTGHDATDIISTSYHSYTLLHYL